MEAVGSGSGEPSNSGQSIARKLAEGIIAGRGDVEDAAQRLAGAATAQPGSDPATPNASDGVSIVINVHGNTVMSDADINKLVRKLGGGVVRALGQAGIKTRLPDDDAEDGDDGAACGARIPRRPGPLPPADVRRCA